VAFRAPFGEPPGLSERTPSISSPPLHVSVAGFTVRPCRPVASEVLPCRDRFMHLGEATDDFTEPTQRLGLERAA
jgi:hypothetical protein